MQICVDDIALNSSYAFKIPLCHLCMYDGSGLEDKNTEKYDET